MDMAAPAGSVMTPELEAYIKNRQQEIQESIDLCSNAPFSKVLMMEQKDLRKLMLNLGDQRPTLEPGNTMRKEVMKLQGAKFHAYCEYAELWDLIGLRRKNLEAAEKRLTDMKGATVREVETAIATLESYLEVSLEIQNHAFPLIRMLNDNEALSLRQLVAAHGEATISRQDHYYRLLESIKCKVRKLRLREAAVKPFKFCRAKVRNLCRKIRRARKKRKGKKAVGLITG
ncbi:hypothetical protein ACLOAV_005761 [Pseudogymnoascus australis]